MIKAALEYLSRKISLVPFKPDKKGSYLKSWQEFQNRLPTEAEIREWWTKWPQAMIGIVTGKISNLLVVDIDSESAKEEIAKYIPESLITPTAITPRGGNHLYFEGPNNGVHIGPIVGLLPGVDIRAEGSIIVAPPSVNVAGIAYQWTIPLQQAKLERIPANLLNIILNNNNIYRGKNKSITNNDLQTLQFLTLGRRDEDLFHIANSLVRGNCNRELIYQVLNIIANNCNPPFPEKDIKVKIDSALGRAERRDRNLADEVFRFVDLTFSYFSITETKKTLQILTSEEQKNLYVIMNRLVKDKILERHPSKNGVYRKVENIAEDIDIFGDTDKPLSVRYPLGIETLSHTMPKSIIIVAGESDAGKTAFLLNFTMLNLDSHAITYFSSEMGPTELKDRISKFTRPLEDWRKVSFKERSSNFQDVIEPDKINIIDYLELADDFYKVGGQIKAIFDKLNTGVAIIALQKKIGSELARGGDFTMEKARIYLTLSRDNICKIIKAKNWVHPMLKPTGKQRKYVLVNGCEFRTRSSWQIEGQEEEI